MITIELHFSATNTVGTAMSAQLRFFASSYGTLSGCNWWQIKMCTQLVTLINYGRVTRDEMSTRMTTIQLITNAKWKMARVRGLIKFKYTLQFYRQFPPRKCKLIRLCWCHSSTRHFGGINSISHRNNVSIPDHIQPQRRHQSVTLPGNQ